jgi:(3S)-malyl-CoA thioesterase
MTTIPLAPRTLLFLPASNPRAIEKARWLDVDMVILDLEDSVREEDKEAAREAAREAAGSFGNKLVAIRINCRESDHFWKDLKAVRKSGAGYVVVPKVEAPEAITYAATCGKPVLAVMNVGHIAGAGGWGVELAGLIAGTNDLAAALKLPPGAGRGPLEMALQLIVLAARAKQLWAIDGVFNRLDDPEGLAEECRHGRNLGFDGKSLIHPGQVDIARAAFSPTEAELADARALVEAASGGAERFRDAMVEEMHVEQARALLARHATP